jgi:hypothetical protein
MHRVTMNMLWYVGTALVSVAVLIYVESHTNDIPRICRIEMIHGYCLLKQIEYGNLS